MIPDRAPTIRELLDFYLEAGVDCALVEAPADRLAAEEQPTAAVKPISAPPPPSKPAAAVAPRGDLAPSPDVAISSARDTARTAPTLEALRAMLEAFERVKEIHRERNGDYRVLLSNGTELRGSRKYRADLNEMLAGFSGARVKTRTR